METTISAVTLANNLSDVLTRIQDRGEHFVVERNGEPVAILAPVGPPTRVTVNEVFELVRRIGFPDAGFAKDLEVIQAEQPKTLAFDCSA